MGSAAGPAGQLEAGLVDGAAEKLFRVLGGKHVWR